MSVMTATAFAVFVWGVIGLVLLVFAYEVYTLAIDSGWSKDRTDPKP